MKDLVVYTAEPSTRRPLDIFRQMAAGLFRSRYIAYRLTLKDIKSDYSKSAFGMIWDFIDPLVLACIFYGLMVVRALDIAEMHMPYPVFVIYGLLLYMTFSESILFMTDIFTRSRGLLTHVNIPREALILSVVFRVLFYSFFRITVLLAVSLALHPLAAGRGESAFSALGFVQFVALYPVIILAGVSIGLFLAPFNTIYRDVGRVARITLTTLRYATPVLWPIPNVGAFALVNSLNPVGPLIDGLRSLATSGVLFDVMGFSIRLGLYTVLFLVSWFIFHISVPVLAEKA